MWKCRRRCRSCMSAIDLDFNLSPFTSSPRSVLHSFFSDQTVFYHTKTAEEVISMRVPVADLTHTQFVQNLTILFILLGFSYLCLRGIRVGLKGLRWRGKGKEKAKEQ